MAKNNYNISQTVEIIPTQVAKAYIIPKSEWNFIKTKVCKIKTGGSILEAIGFLLIGSSVSCLIGYFTTQELSSKTNLGICLATFMGGAIILGYRFIFAAKENTKPGDIVEFMEMVEAKFETDTSIYNDL